MVSLCPKLNQNDVNWLVHAEHQIVVLSLVSCAIGHTIFCAHCTNSRQPTIQLRFNICPFHKCLEFIKHANAPCGVATIFTFPVIHIYFERICIKRYKNPTLVSKSDKFIIHKHLTLRCSQNSTICLSCLKT